MEDPPLLKGSRTPLPEANGSVVSETNHHQEFMRVALRLVWTRMLLTNHCYMGFEELTRAGGNGARFR